MSLVAFHYRSYGTFFLYSKRLHNLHGGFTHYRNYRAEFYNYSKDKAFEQEVVMIINLALLFFLARMVQLIAQLNPMFQEFVSFLKRKGVNIEQLDDSKKEE